MYVIARFIWLVNIVALVYFSALAVFYLVSSVLAFRFLRHYTLRLRSLDVDDLLTSGAAPPVSLLVPAFNEELTCVAAIQALLTLNYPEYEVVVVNDGSTDGTMPTLVEAFDLVRAARLPSAEIV